MLAVVVLLAAASLSAGGPAVDNVLLVTIDDARPCLGSLGCSDAMASVSGASLTPALDALAAESYVFTRAYAQAPLCGPSRSSFLSGRYPSSTGAVNNFRSIRQLDSKVVTLPQFFKEKGFETRAAGKIFHTDLPAGDDYPHSWSQKPFTLRKKCTAAPECEDVCPGNSNFCTVPTSHETFDERATEVTIANIRQVARRYRNTNQRFFLAHGFRRPHGPLVVPGAYAAELSAAETWSLPKHPTSTIDAPNLAYTGTRVAFREKGRPYLASKEQVIPDGPTKRYRRAYMAAVSMVDALLGRILRKLSVEGLADSTAVIVTSDHGFSLGENALWKKSTLFENALRVPLLVRLPASHRAGPPRRIADPVGLLDLWPTLAHLTGLKAPDAIEGHSLTTLMDGVKSINAKGKEKSWVAYSEHPRCGSPKRAQSVDVCNNVNPKKIGHMGYTVRDKTMRLTVWLDYKGSKRQARWDKPAFAVELYEYPLVDTVDYSNFATDHRNLVGSRTDCKRLKKTILKYFKLLAKQFARDGTSPKLKCNKLRYN